MNIIASNGYFEKKQISYNQSKVEILKQLSNANTDWGLDQIRERDIRISDELVDLLKDWGLNKIDENIETLITIPSERMNDYHSFIKMFNKEDNNESRKSFLNF